MPTQKDKKLRLKFLQDALKYFRAWKNAFMVKRIEAQIKEEKKKPR